jgi:hypothetical protein
VSVHIHLKHTGHFLEFCAEERLGFVSSRIRRVIKKASDYLALCNARRKFERKFDIKLHGSDDDREFMAQCNARREVSGMVEIDRSVSRVHEASVNRSRE